jgi:UTP--glucose-1-phosphate uridylyltransferase
MPQKIRKAIFPVAGLGTRFLPATKVMPKEMLTVVDRPLIQYAVEEARAAGIEEFIFITTAGKSVIEDHFDRAPKLESVLKLRNQEQELEQVIATTIPDSNVAYIRQSEPLGSGHAIWCARKFIGDEAFAVILPDDLILSEVPCLKQMVDAYSDIGENIIAVMPVPENHLGRYGIIDIRLDHGKIITIKGMIEKPTRITAPSNVGIVGRYILQPEIFKHLSLYGKTKGEIQLTDGMMEMIVKRHGFFGLKFEGKRFDCGNKMGFLEANIAYALSRSDLKEEFSEIIKKYI